MVKKIYKYPTGATVPEGAIYLKTVTQTRTAGIIGESINCWFVWHYFLVEVETE